MAWSYSASGAASGKDHVRLLIGDTKASEPQLLDEEITVFLAAAGDDYAAAVACCRAIAAKYAREVAESVISTSRNPESRMDHYLRLADQLQEKTAAGLALVGVPTAGGIEWGEKDAALQDTSLVPRLFGVAQMDNPPGWPTPEASRDD
jgi:hypothetical protein